jgi:hypothetical protein
MISLKRRQSLIHVAIPVSEIEVWTRTSNISKLLQEEGMVRVGRSMDHSVFIAARRQVGSDNPFHGTITADIGEEPKLLNGFPVELGITARLLKSGNAVLISQTRQ